jgi:hypothetical protein
MTFMRMHYLLIFFVTTACVVACGKPSVNTEATSKKTAQTSDEKLSPDAAKHAVATLFGPPISEEIMQREFVIGTCIPTPAKYLQHKGQISCGFLIKNGAGSSESQADFYKTSEGWVAMPSSSQEELPFPDPKLKSI